VVSGSTNLLGIIGNPVTHSLSPLMHNAAFRSLGLDWEYVPLPVQSHRVNDALKGLIALGFRGANVTVPHKERVIPFLSQSSQDAAAIGAVNTLVVDDDRLLGFNTDWTGFLNHASESGFDVSGTKALVLGSGGSARAVVYALCSRGAEVTIYSRNSQTAEAIARDVSKRFGNYHIKFAPLEHLQQLAGAPDLVVNTTPVGMHPHVDLCPWPAGIPFPQCRLAYDLVYDPKRTRFMELAETSGAEAVNGLGMLVHQAAAAFKIWTGVEPPIDVMKKAVTQC
jgi:shikimate dehydrogenase